MFSWDTHIGFFYLLPEGLGRLVYSCAVVCSEEARLYLGGYIVHMVRAALAHV